MNTTTYSPVVSRRLISAHQLADKIGYAYDWILRNWRKLSTERDFPAPVLGGGEGRRLRWDERAIDLWLDKQMPQALQNVAGAEYAAGELRNDPVEIVETQNILKHRAEGLGL